MQPAGALARNRAPSMFHMPRAAAGGSGSGRLLAGSFPAPSHAAGSSKPGDLIPHADAAQRCLIFGRAASATLHPPNHPLLLPSPHPRALPPCPCVCAVLGPYPSVEAC